MKQVLSSLRNGRTEVSEVPCPAVRPGQVLIRSHCTLVSAGTERMLVEFGKAGWLEKARQQPDKVRQALDKIRTDGLAATLDAVRRKLDQPLALGYCNAGVVLDVGSGVTGFAPGDRVVSNGRHAEAVCVPALLCAHVPAAVPDEEAAFTVAGAIGLQGIRLVQPTLGEAVVVTGLGLIGLVTVQLLRAHGCRVLGIDYDPARLELARRFGAEVVDLAAGEDPVAAAERFSRGRGADAVLITASTQSSDPVHQAALMCRRRGRIVLVGVVGLELSRADFYEKELSFQVSCSYGPGRYDPNYEEKGQDYPVGHVRWTEQRNFEAVLDMMADRRLDVRPLVSHRFAIEEAEQAYSLIGGGGPSLGILLRYPSPEQKPDAELRSRSVALREPSTAAARPTLAFIGAGNYATGTLIPAFRKTGARLKTLISAGGVSAVHAGRRFGCEVASTDPSGAFADPEINAVVISTRHDTHAALAGQALCRGKHLFVEKPLALNLEELRSIEEEYAAAIAAGRAPILMVGFNRRFSPFAQKMKALLGHVPGPLALVMTVNAGAIPNGHWTQDQTTGGGRIVGEACHFVDLLRFLAGSPIRSHHGVRMDSPTGDTVTLQLTFANGSIGAIHYFANGSRAFPKERLEAFAGGRVLRLDNFRKLSGFGWPGFLRMSGWRQDKGQRACAAAFVRAIEHGGEAPIPFSELIEVSRVTIEIAAALRP